MVRNSFCIVHHPTTQGEHDGTQLPILNRSRASHRTLPVVLLETIREYGLEVLEASGELELTRRAHANYHLRLAEEVDPKLVDSQQTIWLERLEWEHDNLRAAMRWSLER